jgi:predicted nucleotidyltransferase
MSAHRQPDLDLARRFVEAHLPPGRVLLCTITGSHHYGFPSPDSDLDIKGVPFVVLTSPEHEALRALAQASLSRTSFRHYAGYFNGMCREHANRPEPRAKSILYTFRVALTGVHLLKTGQMEADVTVNAPRYGFDQILELVERKAATAEQVVLAPEEDQRFRALWPRLEKMLQDACDTSPLPEQPPNREDIERWLIKLRRDELAD